MSNSNARKVIVVRSRSLVWAAVGAVAAVSVAVVAVHYSGSGLASQADPGASASDDLAALALPPPTSSASLPSPPLGNKLPTKLADEIAAIRPLIADTNGPLDRGTASLALWASTNLTWADLKGLASTSPALFRKDPDQERGRLLCIDGNIQEIRAEKNLSRRLVADRAAPLVDAQGAANPLLGAPQNAGATNHADAGESIRLVLAGSDDASWQVPGGKVFFATVAEPEHGKMDETRLKQRAFVVEAIAVKSAGALVDGDSARFCGILTGIALKGTEMRLEHRAVGMFELPENTGGLARANAPE